MTSPDPTTEPPAHIPTLYFSAVLFDEVSSGRRTVCHLVIDGACAFSEGSEVLLLNSEWSLVSGDWSVRAGLMSVVVQVSTVRLRSAVDADLVKMGLGDLPAAEATKIYLDRWDSLHPSLPSISDPEVWRVEWACPIRAFALAT